MIFYLLKLYELFIKFICLFIPVDKRREKRNRLLLLPHLLIKNIKSKKSYKEFNVNKVKKKSVLLVEPNPYHFELQPGYCKYFEELGYHVDVIVQPNLKDDFAYQFYPNIPTIYYLSLKYQKKALRLLKVKDYDFVFLCTSAISSDNLRTSYVNWLGYEPDAKYGILMIEHNVIPFVKDFGHERYIQEGRSFTLAGQYNIPILNPHYFGEIKLTSKSKENIFVAIVNEKQNVNLLFDTCRALISQNITNFKITIAGRSVVKSIPNDLEKYINITGLIKFTELWKIYNNADYIIPFLNPEIHNQLRFKDGSVTGSWQIIMGFLKPAIIHQEYTEYYRLNTNNSIIYKLNFNLVNAMKQGINMEQVEYKKLQKSIRELAKDVYSESLNNLIKAIHHE